MKRTGITPANFPGDDVVSAFWRVVFERNQERRLLRAQEFLQLRQLDEDANWIDAQENLLTVQKRKVATRLKGTRLKKQEKLDPKKAEVLAEVARLEREHKMRPKQIEDWIELQFKVKRRTLQRWRSPPKK